MRKINVIATGIVISLLALSFPVPIFAADTDFVANADITVEGVTLGSTTASVIIMNSSSSQSWTFNSGALTITNPSAAGTFKIGSSSTDVGTINVTNSGGTLVECAPNTTPGTSYVIIPVTADTYTVTISTTAGCSTSLCTTLANVATYNYYPTCGAASCAVGYRVSGSGASATCVLSGGGGGGGGSSGGGTNTLSVEMNQSKPIGAISTAGTNVFLYINSKVEFTAPVSKGGSENHSVTVNNLDLAKKRITIVIQSNPVTVELGEGETKQVDLDGDGKNDIEVTFNKLVVNKVDFTVKTIKSAVVFGGELVKLACSAKAGVNDPCKAVYYVGYDGKRYVFPNEKVYASWYSDFSTVKTISSEDLAKYLIGGNVTYRPGVKMVKIQTDPKVYAVTKGGVLRWVKTEGIAKDIYGAEWNKMIDDVADAFFINYKMGNEIAASADYNAASAKTGSSDINADKGLKN